MAGVDKKRPDCCNNPGADATTVSSYIDYIKGASVIAKPSLHTRNCLRKRATQSPCECEVAPCA